MRLPPPEVRASWPPANYENPETRGPALLIIQLIMLPIALIVLLLRFYVRISIMGKVESDDWFMVAAALCGTGVTVCVILASSLYGWSLHIWDLKYETIVSNRKVSMAVQALFVFATSFAKVSILISYLRLAPQGSWFRKLTQGTIAFVALFNSAFIVVLFTQCRPTSSYWNIIFSKSDCVPEGPPLITQASLTVLSDFLVWILPLPTLYKARLPLSQRIALIVLFSFGGVVVIGAILRLYWIWHVVERTYDVTWEGFHLWIWTAVEVHLGVICGCVPWLKSLVKFWKNGGSTAAGYSHNRAGSRSLGKMTAGSKKGKLNGEEEGADFRCDRGAVFRMVSVNGKKLDGDAYMDLDSYDGSSTAKLDVEAEQGPAARK
ncbi:hypothetical protein QC762_300290 [Podospora pseudocomata]|uniref:Rhodopsin domain-containing protein n=2 Tax=Podospora TaxID=5144 RepID=A0ABR0GHH1_9PEZI|nr:hypothetical protein QC762_300290 [Podospora pseudocomata]KAK4677610.1 hypothetical protein QC764_300290 [Podospora pseudoanserina]